MPSTTLNESVPEIGTPRLTGGLSHLTPRPRLMGKASNSPNLLKQSMFKIGHQKINIDVDLSANTIDGVTEITVLPFLNKLKIIKLDCREMKIKNLYINGTRNLNYIYDDMLYMNDPSMFGDNLVEDEINVFDLYSDKYHIHQHHFIKQKLNYIFGEKYYNEDEELNEIRNTQELKILLPDNMKFELTDINSITTPSGSQPSTMTPTHLKSKNTLSEVYTPIQIKIEYVLKNPKNGLNFVTNDDINKRSWHAYTTNSDYNVSTSSWVPCIDNLNSRSTWTIEVSVPRTLNDIGHPRLIGSKEALRYHQERNRRNENNDDDDIEDTDDNPDLVVCAADINNVKETPHQIDLSKKVVSWSIFNSVSAHHVGWAVGFFDSFVLADHSASENNDFDDINDNDNNDFNEKESTSSPITIYALPEDMELAKNTCIIANKALDYFSNEFGSFPFSSYSFAFVKFSPVDSNSYAGLSIMSSSLLYPADLIEPMFTTTDVLLKSIASQWSGVNIVPHSFEDMWCTTGIAGYMAISFIEKLMGTNEYRYKIKKLTNKIISEDVNKRPIARPFLKYPVSETDLEFMKLKSPIVFFILDNRMTKTDKSFGLSRVIPKLFLQAMSGDLPNGTLSTDHLQYVCEKVNRNKLESFFKQWVFGAGTPSFKVSQRFNKKKGMIEMIIRQVQHHENKQVPLTTSNFIDDALCYMNKEPSTIKQNVFTGPMTIRVHESDGTPYEHIIHIKEMKTTIDIQLSKKIRKIKKKDEGVDPGINFNQFGDILTTDDEKQKWNFQDWNKRDEESLASEPFEWIRADVDFEWIAKIDILQPDFMFGSQLIFDRDVEAQCDAIRYFGEIEKPSIVYCTALVRTILDERYFYGVRIAAAEALATSSNGPNDFIGVKYLIKAYRELFCFPDSTIPKSNDFNDFRSYLIQREVPIILSKITDQDGRVPADIQNLLFNLVKYNDNSMNDYQDSLYMKDLIIALTTSAISGWRKDLPESNNAEFAEKVNDEIVRLQKLDEWRPSHQKILQITCVESRVRMALAGALKLSLEALLMNTLDSHPMDSRVDSFKGLLVLSGFKNQEILEYFLKVSLLNFYRPLYTRKLIEAFIESICLIAINGSYVPLEDQEEESNPNSSSSTDNTRMIIIDEGSNSDMKSKHDTYARATIKGSIDILRRDLYSNESLKNVIWEMIHSSLLGNYVKRNLFLISEIVYQEQDSLIVKLPVPSLPIQEFKKKVVAKNLGNGQILLKREGRFKIQLLSRKSSTALFHKKTNKIEEISHYRTPPTGSSSTASTSKRPSLKISLKSSQETTPKLKKERRKSEPEIIELSEDELISPNVPSFSSRLVRTNGGMVTIKLPSFRSSTSSLVRLDPIDKGKIKIKFTNKNLFCNATRVTTSKPSTFSSLVTIDPYNTALVTIKLTKKVKEDVEPEFVKQGDEKVDQEDVVEPGAETREQTEPLIHVKKKSESSEDIKQEQEEQDQEELENEEKEDEIKENEEQMDKQMEDEPMEDEQQQSIKQETT
ncbi:taf2 [Candida jiufengensis]|uniref:taf2 n=1 Tax=Candida jiufengensis TaxID=497108 RepID=UPI002224853F|nr:taf2 [Candida jiufengensis]KAI5956915.1 taf2 [Candida jiufengensis]